jgi:hypothetical protein
MSSNFCTNVPYVGEGKDMYTCVNVCHFLNQESLSGPKMGLCAWARKI